jgi:8-oxo-dGTP pyrophosphatase MutT (NUDIX family)
VDARRLAARGMQRYWRLARGLTLGAQACVLDGSDRALLVRHGYRPGWHFPGGGVEKRETLEQALARELEEEAGVLLTQRPQLFGVFSNQHLFPGDHIALYVARAWRQPSVPKPNREIAEIGFFARDALPADIHAATARRIAEILDGRQPAEMW